MSTPPNRLRSKLKAMQAARDATAVTPSADIGIGDKIDALLNNTDPFPYRARPVSPPNPHVPPVGAPNADSVEKRIRGESQPEDTMSKYGDPRESGKVGKPNTLEGDLEQADINLRNKKLTGFTKRK